MAAVLHLHPSFDGLAANFYLIHLTSSFFNTSQCWLTSPFIPTCSEQLLWLQTSGSLPTSDFFFSPPSDSEELHSDCKIVACSCGFTITHIHLRWLWFSYKRLGLDQSKTEPMSLIPWTSFSFSVAACAVKSTLGTLNIL